MRCLTKCMAMFGLGHYIYAGEDIPKPYTTDSELSDKQKNEIDKLVKEAELTDEDWDRFYAWQKVQNIHDIQPKQFDNVILALKTIRDREV